MTATYIQEFKFIIITIKYQSNDTSQSWKTVIEITVVIIKLFSPVIAKFNVQQLIIVIVIIVLYNIIYMRLMRLDDLGKMFLSAYTRI